MLRRLLLLVMIFMSLPLTGCTKEILAPVVEEKIELPPFRYPVENIAVGYTYVQDVNFYAPIGVAPQIEHKVTEDPKNPANLELWPPRLELVSNQLCEPNCTRMAWRLLVLYKATQAGEATVTIHEASNPREKISFMVIATVWDDGAGKG